MIGRRRARGGYGRNEAANRQRGERARNHLARQREREMKRRKSDVRQRERARTTHFDPVTRRRVKSVLLFAASLFAGVLLAGPIQRGLTHATGGGLSAIETIAIQGNDHLTFAYVAKATGVARGGLLADVDPAEVEARLATDPWIRDAHVLRLPPSTLLVRVEERRARAVLVDESGLRLVDESGNPFARASAEQASGLPRLVGGDALPDDHAEILLVTALSLVERMHAVGAMGLAPEGGLELHLPRGSEPEGWQVHAPGRNTWVVLGHENLMERFERLVELLEDDEVARQVAEGQRRIDLRFAGQAVLQSAQRWESHRVNGVS